jgi:hypothetical protein
MFAGMFLVLANEVYKRCSKFKSNPIKSNPFRNFAIELDTYVHSKKGATTALKNSKPPEEKEALLQSKQNAISSATTVATVPRSGLTGADEAKYLVDVPLAGLNGVPDSSNLQQDHRPDMVDSLKVTLLEATQLKTFDQKVIVATRLQETRVTPEFGTGDEKNDPKLGYGEEQKEGRDSLLAKSKSFELRERMDHAVTKLKKALSEPTSND